eukprot:COSAG05_NODE_374_length_10669_cov_71.040587_9_plen_93_part_00
MPPAETPNRPPAGDLSPDDDGIIIARSDRSDVTFCNPEYIELRQIDDFQKGTGPFLKVINLALFSRCEAKFHAEKLHADARCHAPYLPIAKL